VTWFYKWSFEKDHGYLVCCAGMHRQFQKIIFKYSPSLLWRYFMWWRRWIVLGVEVKGFASSFRHEVN